MRFFSIQLDISRRGASTSETFTRLKEQVRCEIDGQGPPGERIVAVATFVFLQTPCLDVCIVVVLILVVMIFRLHFYNIYSMM